MNTVNLANAKNCSEDPFDSIYESLYNLSAKENSSMYLAALCKAKTPAQKKACAGCYAGRWQQLFNKWIKGDVHNVCVLEAIKAGIVSEILLT